MRPASSIDPGEGELVGLSNFQTLVWTGQHLEPESPMYNMAFKLEISSALDVARFQDAVRKVFNQTETHRFVVTLQNGVPFFKLLPATDFELPVVDFQESDASDVQTWCKNRCGKIFDLSQRLFDTALLKLSPNRFVWYVCHHHLISDAWSVTELIRRVDLIYNAMGENSQCDEILSEFRDERVGSQDVGDSQSSISKPNSAPDSSVEAAPTRFYGNVPARIGSFSRRVSIVQPNDENEVLLSELAQRKELKSFSPQLTQFNLLLTLVYSYLFRVSGQQVFCVGTPFHNRLTKSAKQSLGVFIDFHPLAVSVEPDDSFASLHKKVQIAANRYLKDALSGKGAQGSNARFNTVLNFIHASFGEFDGSPVSAEWLYPERVDREHHLRVHVEDFGGKGRLAINGDFNSDVFDEAQQQLAVEHFRKLIQGMASDWSQRINSVDIRSKSERKLHIGFQESDTDCDPDGSRNVLERFQQVVSNQSESVALRFRGISGKSVDFEDVTYGQLDEWSDRVAANLINSGLGKSGRVVSLMDRSPNAIFSILGILKAGMSFVPVDPNWPSSRIQYLVEDSQAGCVLSHSKLAQQCEFGVPRINIDEFSTDDSKLEIGRPDLGLAYVLYTSGSTGNPKGVEISHAALDSYVGWASDYYCGERKLAFPLFTPMTFDLTITSIFVPLVTGGEIVIYPESDQQSDVALLKVIEDDIVDVIKLTPSHLSLLQDRDLSSLRVRQLILGGEDLKSELARRVFNAFPTGLKIHNEYGPTEATVGCIVHSLGADDALHGTSVPIGSPITGMRAYVLNQEMIPVPVGVVGNLYVAGKGLANGYLGREELTSEKFIPDPFGAANNERMYATGDLARFNPQGLLDYLGRRDQQVKIRGARIELGAIESALNNHPRIVGSVVTTFDADPASQKVEYCSRCGLASNYPDSEFDDELVCDQCRSFESYHEKANSYFKNMDELEQLFSEQIQLRKQGKSEAEYDCLSLLSGGKDSTYMLARLADMDLKILAFTLDNGYISDEAKANIRRVVETLGVDHHFGSTPAMNEIFVDSLKRYANVCQGCFKTIYTLSTNLAREKKIPFIATGLSRGQFFETRLTEDLFKEPVATLVQIDQAVKDARVAYHQVDDACHRLLDVEALQKPETFEQVQYVDFFRYCDVDLDEMYTYLDERLPWVRPSDTGRSTNCLINDAGIYVHKRNRGFHNYALPYSWDVRMGHKNREAALEELDDEIDVENVHRILNEIGYDGELADQTVGSRLVAYYSAENEIELSELKGHLAQRLPDFMQPSKFVRIDELPLSANGKVDLSALPDPFDVTPKKSKSFVEPTNDIERQLCKAWSEILRVPEVGVTDNFFDLGGDSILAIQIIAKSNRAGIRLTPSLLFQNLTVRELAAAYQASEAKSNSQNVAEEISDAVPVVPVPTPIQSWALEHEFPQGSYWNQVLGIRLPQELANEEGRNRILAALTLISNRHDALRTKVQDGKLTVLPPVEESQVPLEFVDSVESGKSPTKIDFSNIEEKIHLSSDELLGGVVVRYQEGDAQLFLVGNHMAVDAVSWQVIVSDLQSIIESGPDSLGPSNSRPLFAEWGNQLAKNCESRFDGQMDYWRNVVDTAPPFDSLENAFALVADQDEWVAELDQETSRRLMVEVPKSRISVNELLLAALGKTLFDQTDREAFRILIERHGREPLFGSDFSQTVGWFTSLSPFRFQRPSSTKMSEFLRDTKENSRAVPDQGIGYGALRYLHPKVEVRERLQLTNYEFVFNFLGRRHDGDKQPFSISSPLNLNRCGKIRLKSAVEMNLSLTSVLQVSWASTRVVQGLDVPALSEAYLQNVRQLVDESLNESSAVVSATDFPLANLDSDKLKNLAGLLGKKKTGDGTKK